MSSSSKLTYAKELESDLKPSFIKPINKFRRSSSSSSPRKTTNRLHNFNKNKKIKKTNDIAAADTTTYKMSIENYKDEQTAIDILLYMKQDKHHHQYQQYDDDGTLLSSSSSSYNDNTNLCSSSGENSINTSLNNDDDYDENNTIPYAYELSIQEMYNHLLYMKQIEYKSGYFFIKN